ncbi:hypothetical protein HCU40_02640 [Pseudanabaena biceps]|nr:hypothetical protein [Pseudanabaena biceps]
MSTKKKVGISDLLRDEVQKSTTSEQTIEVTAEAVAEPIADPKITNIPESAPQAKSLIAPASNASVNPEDSNKKIVELESSFKRSQQREAELSEAIADLQKELKFSHTNIELLQKSLAAIEGLKNELEQQLVEVKRDNLRLAEANIQLSEQIKTLESSPAKVSEVPSSSQLATQSPQPIQGNRATPRKQPVDQPYPHRDRTPYTRPTGSNEQLQRINNKNIGWMD